MYTLEPYDDRYYSFVIRKDAAAVIWADTDDKRHLQELVNAANARLEIERHVREMADAVNANARVEEDIDPMSPDYAALSQHEPTSGIEDSRDSAGQGAGPPEPFTPTITVLPRVIHGHAPDCTCPECAQIQAALARSVSRPVEAF